MNLRLLATLVFCAMTSHYASAAAVTSRSGNDKISGKFHTGCINKKHMALTFDDGPFTFTPQLLSLLAKNNVKATFFQIGKNVDTYPNYTKSIQDAGHLLGSHTYSHPDCTTLTKEQLSSELKRTDEAIQRAAGFTPVLFRYPMGEFNDRTDDIVNEHGKIPISWNVDTEDWKYHSKNSNKIFGNFPTQVKSYATDKGVIGLFHSEMYASSMRAIQKVINWGKNNGYTFVLVDECIGYQESVSPGPDNSTTTKEIDVVLGEISDSTKKGNAALGSAVNLVTFIVSALSTGITFLLLI